ncbi:MAG: leucine-rich repeat domain-containing protein [Clostridia bacterium]|nr:leucine-rich repeat domain-containing protein [Clostridia bacterium]
MKHAKLLLAIVLIFILVFMLVACGEKDPVDNGGTQGPQNGVGAGDNPGDNPGETPDDNPDDSPVSDIDLVVGANGNWFYKGVDTNIKEENFPSLDMIVSGSPHGYGAPDASIEPGGLNAYIDMDNLDLYMYQNGEWLLEGNIPWFYASHEGTYGLKFVKINDTECVVSAGDTYEINEIVVPSTYLGYAVVGFLERETDYGGVEGAFQGRSNITKITLPDTIKTIGKCAFYECVSLVSIVIPEGVTLIDEAAFAGCTNLKNVTIPSTVESFGAAVFRGCENLESITIPEGVTTIPDNGFSSCLALQTVVIPSSVTIIDNSAFSGCTGLKSVVFGENSKLEFIGGYVFYCCSSLESIVIPDGVTTIGAKAFYMCESLVSAVIPDTVENIYEYAFGGCNNATIYCHHEELPSGWDGTWNSSGRPVCWAGEWEYDEDGNPKPLA